MQEYDYKRTEELLEKLIVQLGDVLTDAEQQEVREFIEAGEYGLALETAVDILEEEKKAAPPSSIGTVNELCEIMQLDPKPFRAKLSAA